jgi:glutamyl/glutaminyl-tRNA synthetase
MIKISLKAFGLKIDENYCYSKWQEPYYKALKELL